MNSYAPPRWASPLFLSSALVRFQPGFGATEPGLRALAEEAASRPGGMVRGLLSLQVSAACGLEAETALRLAVAVEYFHLASLLLDDLPCMDDAHERRGHPCAHVVHGEPRAILGALLFVNRAHLLINEACDEAPAAVRRRMRHLLDGALGGRGLCDGQALDLTHVPGGGPRGVARVAVGKTVPLLRLALMLPSVLGNASVADQIALNRLSVYWGLAYQHLDDLADARSTPAETGKTTGRDAALFRPNLVHEIGATACLARLGDLLDRADRVLGGLSARLPGLAPAVFWQRRLVSLYHSAA